MTLSLHRRDDVPDAPSAAAVLARVVELFAWLAERLHPRGVGVVVEAEHLCMTLRGVQAPGTTTTTSALRGVLREDARTRAEFLALTDGGRR
ncbi:GTP cyclohydrolase I [Geodermatophilus sp. SYSU D00691]